MARVHPFQTNFTSGEISPKLFGQVDFKKYNMVINLLSNLDDDILKHTYIFIQHNTRQNSENIVIVRVV